MELEIVCLDKRDALREQRDAVTMSVAPHLNEAHGFEQTNLTIQPANPTIRMILL
jgi:hypothetical protein